MAELHAHLLGAETVERERSRRLGGTHGPLRHVQPMAAGENGGRARERTEEEFWDYLEGRRPGPPCSRHLGARCLDVDPENGTIAIEFNPRAEFLNPAGGIQGGFLAAMLDETTSPAVKAVLEPRQFPTAVEFKVTFIRPARPEKLIGRARIIHRGGSIVFVEGELRTPDGDLVATSTQTIRVVTIDDCELDFGGEARSRAGVP